MLKIAGKKLIGVKIDTKLSFENHVSSLCQKTNQTLHALARVVHFMDLVKRNSLMKAFLKLDFNYCSLISTFHCRQLNNQINKIHEIALRLPQKDNNKLTFNDLLEVDNSVAIQKQNLQILATEIFKIKKQLGT